MSETFPAKKAGFPFGLTIATAVAFAILCFLGAWQMKRLAWKQDLLARIEMLKTAPPVPSGHGADRPGHRSRTRPGGGSASSAGPVGLPPLSLAYGIREGDVVWRAQALCGLQGGPYNLILVDRGVVPDLTGKVDTPRAPSPSRAR
jgi:surfeit locus 1 family protein